MKKRGFWEPICVLVPCAVSPGKEIEHTRQTASRPMHGVGVLHAVHHVIGIVYIVGQ